VAAAGAVAVALAVVVVADVGTSDLDAIELVAVYAGLLASAAVGARWGEVARRADDAAEQLKVSRAELVRNVSHELRTPLTVIQGLLTTLFQHWDSLDEPAKLDLIDSASSNVASLDSSVLHFIDVGRLERGEVEMVAEEVDLAAVLSSVKSKLAHALAGYEVKDKLQVRTWRSDPTAVARILELLLENAARFSPVGSVITVSSAESSGRLELAVADQGKGVPPTVQAKVFEPFWRSDVADSGVSRGAGIGLYVAKRLTEQLGGEIGFTSVKGRGSRFVATLPAA
jgi:two-component system sensor histidine kinase KdpD